MDNPAYVDKRMVGATPPNVYDLKPREKLFHGVAALRMTPVGENEMHGRTGLLVHSYLLGPNGDSNGCVSIKDYDRFLAAYRTAMSGALSWCRACAKASLRRGVHHRRHDSYCERAADSDTPLRAVFKINLNGKTVSIARSVRPIASSPISARSSGSNSARCMSTLVSWRCSALPIIRSVRFRRQTRCGHCSSAPGLLRKRGRARTQSLEGRASICPENHAENEDDRLSGIVQNWADLAR
jgi:hypothetical protein